ncbi:CRISPR-associated endonuclease Cas2 [Arcanobacterium phocae]|uniref:CRISPR-associated endonuclease Cas2 n=1 Tax=Arcanobacterium phocae TaxID=131112 RepID=UPI001C0EAA7A|nr:CRISPR-associated endonuclease Cas2 [Arcanobacterium phocae]
MVMFDLPTSSKAARISYRKFREFLLDDGYFMEQYSVYSRLALGRDSLETHLQRIKANLPSAGTVTVFSFTDKQYSDRKVLIQSRKTTENQQDSQLTLFF